MWSHKPSCWHVIGKRYKTSSCAVASIHEAVNHTLGIPPSHYFFSTGFAVNKLAE